MKPQEPIKILELKGSDWLGGISIQTTIPVGGNFQSATNFDPFETMGYLQPSLTPVKVDNSTIDTSVTSSVAVPGYVYVMGNRASAGAKFFYRINTSDQTVTDYKAEFLSTELLMSGLGYSNANGRIIYFSGTNGLLRSNTNPPVLANEVTIEGSPGINNQPFLPKFVLGPDKIMYYTTGNASIGKITNFIGTAGNNPTYLTPQSDLYTKDAVSDGTYLVVIADDNFAFSIPSTTATAQCRVFFMDVANTSKTTADVIWDIPDRYLIGCQFVEDTVLVFGYAGIWACSAGASPRLVLPLTSDKLPSGPYQITKSSNNIVSWSSVSSGRQTYSYGSLTGKKILYNPFQPTQDGTQVNTMLTSSGPYFYAGVSDGASNSDLYVLNSGSTRGSSEVETANIVLSQPFSLSYVKVTLKDPLSTGQGIDVSMYDSAGTTILASSPKEYSTVGAKKTFKFEPVNSGTMVRHFEDFTLLVNPRVGAVVERVTVYGIPATDASQLI